MSNILLKKTLRDIDVTGRTVLVRADYNVPLEPVTDETEGDATRALRIASDLRIRAELPTLEYLLEHQVGKIIIVSHLGRPQGKVVPELSLRVVAEKLAELLPGVPVNFVDQTIGDEVEAAVEELSDGGVLLLENLRFDPREEENSAIFARAVVDSTHAEIFVQDGFAVTHRAHASTAAIADLIPAVAGLLLEKEVAQLSQLVTEPARPFTVIIGGSKVDDKQALIDQFSQRADHVLIGGKIAADGYVAQNDKVYVAEDFDTDETGAKLDIGPISTMKFVSTLQDAKTVLWNGVLGKVEDPAYTTASAIVATTLGERRNLESIICGGDTTGFVEELQSVNPELRYSLISTGGGAALEFLLGVELPGIASLENKTEKS